MMCMSRLPLAQVTLCAVDTRAPSLAAQSLVQSMRHCDFGRVLLFTCDRLPADVIPGIDTIKIEPIRSGAEYSHFVMRQLPAHIHTSHALITQWDGFVTHPEAWTDEFFLSRDARRLARAMLIHGMPAAARQLLQRRQSAGRTDPNTRLLGAAARLMALLSRRAP